MNDLTRQFDNSFGVTDALLLNYYNNVPVDVELSEYKIEIYGTNYKERLEHLLTSGYLTFASYEDSLDFLTIQELKNILRERGLKLSGKKKELVDRVAKNVARNEVEHLVPKLYTATERGKLFLKNYSAYIENEKEGYEFLNSEISAVEKALRAKENFNLDEIFLCLFKRNLLKHAQNNNYGLLRNTYLTLSHFYQKRKNYNDALKSLFTVIYLDLTGMSNGNVVCKYEEALDSVFDTSIWNKIDKIITLQNIQESDITTIFFAAVDECVAKPPFSYFADDTMISIIFDRLHGQENLLQKYKSKRNIPSSRNKTYTYYTKSNYSQDSLEYESNKPFKKNIKISKSSSTGSGCLLPCLIIFFLIIIFLY